MKNKTSQYNPNKQVNIAKEYTSENLTAYSGGLDLYRFMENLSIPQILDNSLPTIRHSATKFSNSQILLSSCLAFLCDTNRLSNIERFTADPLIREMLALPKQIDEDTLSYRLKQLGESGARQLTETLFRLYSSMLSPCGFENITIDVDSSAEITYGNQEGAAKGYNTQKKGAKSYNPNLAFCTQTKQLLCSWFRTGSAYTSNGTEGMISQMLSHLPSTIKKILFRMDSGYFSDSIMSHIEKEGYDYLIKVKLKNFTQTLESQKWENYNATMSFCKFEHKCSSWSKARVFYGARRVVTKNVIDFFNSGELLKTVEYEYCAFCTSLDLAAIDIYKLYQKRGECENWIENIKHQLHGCHTLTNDFWANDILWQLATLAYNISVTFRLFAGRKFWREEHRTFFRWFIAVPGKIVKTGRQIILKISKHYLFIEQHKKCIAHVYI